MYYLAEKYGGCEGRESLSPRDGVCLHIAPTRFVVKFRLPSIYEPKLRIRAPQNFVEHCLSVVIRHMDHLLGNLGHSWSKATPRRFLASTVQAVAVMVSPTR
jgi:hypothetical protein